MQIKNTNRMLNIITSLLYIFFTTVLDKGTNRPWNETSRERNVQNLCFVPGNETSWERKVQSPPDAPDVDAPDAYYPYPQTDVQTSSQITTGNELHIC